MKATGFIRTTVYVLSIVAFASCNQNNSVPVPVEKAKFQQPVTVPLKFDGEKKLDWNSIKATPVKPLVKKVDLSKLPSSAYDTSGFKPMQVTTAKFDYNALPSRDLDIDKLPTHPLKFTTCILPPPKLIKAGLPQLKDAEKALYDFGEAQGLEGTTINDVFSDRAGFLWIATDRGFFRYDGESLFQYFFHDRIPAIYSMVQDKAGNIWMGTQYSGLLIFDPSHGIVKHFEPGKGLNIKNATRLLLDDQQRVWFTSATDNGVFIIDPAKNSFKVLGTAQGISSERTFAITTDLRNNIWITTFSGDINVIDPVNKKIKYITGKQGLINNVTYSSIIRDSKGRIWAAPLGGIGMSVIDPEKGTIQYIKEANGLATAIFAICNDGRGQVWVGTDDNGVKIINIDKKSIKSLHTANISATVQRYFGSVKSEFIENICRDSHGQMWIATQDGLSFTKEGIGAVKHTGLANTSTLFLDNKGLIWQGGIGICIIDTINKKVSTFTKEQGLSNDTIQIISELNNSIYIGTGTGIDIIDPSRSTLYHIGRAQGIVNKTVQSIATDREGKIWMGGQDNGIDVYDPRTQLTKHIGIKEGLTDINITDLCLDTKGNMWVATFNGGVDEIDAGNGSIKYLNKLPGFNEAFKPRMFSAGNNGDMWIGTDKGIYVANIKNNTLTPISTDQGLINEEVISMLGHNGRIYAGTNGGISVITPNTISADKKMEIESYGASDGVKKIFTGSFMTDAMAQNGLYLWGDDGVTIFDLSRGDHSIPAAYITGINVMDKPVHFIDQTTFEDNKDTIKTIALKPLLIKGKTPVNTGYAFNEGLSWDGVDGPYNLPVNLQLPYNKNYLRFNFSALNLTNRDTTWYRYLLSGVDKTWSEESTEPSSRNYYNLTPGKYTFRVVSRTSDNGWSAPAEFTFSINPPWWQTWWAWMIYILIFGGCIWAFSYYRSLSLIKEKRELEYKVNLRTAEVLEQKEEIASQRDNLEKAFDELKVTQTQLVQREKMASLGELTAGIAHEIQNPLNFINNFSEVNAELIEEMDQEIDKGDLDEVKAIAADIKANQQKISQHGKRADFIIKGMLQHSRTSTGEKQETNINILADEFLKLSYHGLRAKDKNFNAEMITNFEPNLPKLTVVQQDIGRVFINLFNNAFYAVNEKKKTAGADYKPEVTVSASADSNNLMISVKDNGNGIPDAIKDKIMQPFFTTKPTGEGTGLGLSLSYDIVVKGHGGKIEVDTKEGEGSEFIITLPIS